MKKLRALLLFALVALTISALTACFFGSGGNDTEDTPPAPPQDVPPVQCTEHSWDAGIRLREPSCTLDGIYRYTCTACGEIKDEPIPKIPHTFNEEKWARDDDYHWRETVCNCFSGAISDKGEHTFDEGRIWYEPNCTQYGYLVYSCTVCGHAKFEQLPRTEHTYEEKWSYNDDYHWREANCGCTSEWTDHASHDWDEGVVTTEPTCQKKGVRTLRCTVCEATKEIEEPKTDIHAFGEGIITAPTCTAEGFTTYVCLECGKSYTDTPTATVPHVYEAVVTPPTCVAEGYTTHTCSECGKFYTDTPQPTVDHTFHTIEFSPTCITPGHIYTSCTVCGFDLVDKEIAKTPHPYEANVILPTCTEQGYTTYTCSYCGDKYISDTTEKLPHEYVVTREEASCTSAPYDIHTCKNCGTFYSVCVGDPLPHTYQAEVIPPTCKYDGYTRYTCSDCGTHYNSDRTSKIPHNYVNIICTECGINEYSIGLKYLLNGDKTYYTVTGIGECADTDLIIPHTHEGIPVREIKASAFEGNTRITSVTFLEGGDGEITVSELAFAGCTALKRISISSGISNIHERAFSACTSLESITVSGESATYLSAGNCLINTASKTLLLGCKSSILPKDGSFTIIGAYAFYKNTAITELVIPEGVETIGDYAFSGSVIKTVTFPKSLTRIGIYAFSSCYDLESATFGETEGWYITESLPQYNNQMGGINMSTSPADPELTAHYLWQRAKYYWYRKTS